MARTLTIVSAGVVAGAVGLSGCVNERRAAFEPPAGQQTQAAAPEPASAAREVAPGPAVLAKTVLTNQTGTRVRVLLAVVEVPKDPSSSPRWWWGDAALLTASFSQGYELRARVLDRVPPGAARSVLIRVETLLGTRVETTDWYNLIGPVPKRIDFVRAPEGAVVPACFAPSAIEPLARELWPSDGGSPSASVQP